MLKAGRRRETIFPTDICNVFHFITWRKKMQHIAERWCCLRKNPGLRKPKLCMRVGFICCCLSEQSRVHFLPRDCDRWAWHALLLHVWMSRPLQQHDTAGGGHCCTAPSIPSNIFHSALQPWLTACCWFAEHMSDWHGRAFTSKWKPASLNRSNIFIFFFFFFNYNLLGVIVLEKKCRKNGTQVGVNHQEELSWMRERPCGMINYNTVISKRYYQRP